MHSFDLTNPATEAFWCLFRQNTFNLALFLSHATISFTNFSRSDIRIHREDIIDESIWWLGIFPTYDSGVVGRTETKAVEGIISHRVLPSSHRGHGDGVFDHEISIKKWNGTIAITFEYLLNKVPHYFPISSCHSASSRDIFLHWPPLIIGVCNKLSLIKFQLKFSHKGQRHQARPTLVLFAWNRGPDSLAGFATEI